MIDLPKVRANNMALTREGARGLFFGGSGRGFPGTARLARASLLTYGKNAAAQQQDPRSYLTFFHGTEEGALPWMKQLGLRPGARDQSGAGGVYFTTNLDAAGYFAEQEQVQYPVPSTVPETAEKTGEAEPGQAPRRKIRSHVVMARVRPGSDAVVRREGLFSRGVRRAWTQSAESPFGSPGGPLSCLLGACWSCCGFRKYIHPQLCTGDDMTRRLRLNQWGDDVVALYPHVYGERALGEKGFELWFLEFEADKRQKCRCDHDDIHLSHGDIQYEGDW